MKKNLIALTLTGMLLSTAALTTADAKPSAANSGGQTQNCDGGCSKGEKPAPTPAPSPA